MKQSEKPIALESRVLGAESNWNSENTVGVAGRLAGLFRNSDLVSVLATFLTTLSVFGIYLIQGIILAKILGPVGRGEFGTAMFFPRDVFLYAGLFGGIEIVNSYAVRELINVRSLKYSAAKVGLISGVITAVVAAVVSVVVLVCVGKMYLIPFCLACCLFVPWEHMQLTISAVDRGTRKYFFYNLNRLLYAATFLFLLVVVFGLNLDAWIGISSLWLVCCLFVLGRVIGIVPTLRGMDVWNQVFRRSSLATVVHRSADQNRTQGDDLSIEVPTVWQLLKNGRFYALSMLASELFERLDMFLIVAIASVTESGYYFVAVPAAQLLTVAPNALGVFTFNAGADKSKRVSLRQAVSVMAGTAALQVFSAAVFSLIVPILIIKFFGDEFAPAIPFAIWLLPACAIKGYLQAVDGYLKGRGKPMIGVWARSLSIVVMVAFVVGVYAGLIVGPEQKLLCIPMAACLGQSISMLIISVAVIRDTIDQDSATELGNSEPGIEGVAHGVS